MAQGRVKEGHQLYIRAEQWTQHLLDAGDDGVEIQDLGAQHLPSAEGQQLGCEAGRALGGEPNLLHAQTLVLTERHGLDQEVTMTRNDREHVIEVVGDAAGELPDCLHLLSLTEVLLELLALGDVTQDDLHRGETMIGKGGCSDLDRNLCSIKADDLFLHEWDRLSSFQ